MPLAIEERTVRRQHCDRCDRDFDHVTAFVLKEGSAHAVYYAACHGHPEHEAWIDVVLGTWGNNDASDHVLFSCQLRAEGAAAVDGPVAVSSDASLLGKKLTREQALAHPRTGDFWAVVDLVAKADSAVFAHVFSGA